MIVRENLRPYLSGERAIPIIEFVPIAQREPVD